MWSDIFEPNGYGYGYVCIWGGCFLRGAAGCFCLLRQDSKLVLIKEIFKDDNKMTADFEENTVGFGSAVFLAVAGVFGLRLVFGVGRREIGSFRTQHNLNLKP